MYKRVFRESIQSQYECHRAARLSFSSRHAVWTHPLAQLPGLMLYNCGHLDLRAPRDKPKHALLTPLGLKKKKLTNKLTVKASAIRNNPGCLGYW